MNEDELKVLGLFREEQLFEPWDEHELPVYRLNDECYLITYKRLERDTGLSKTVAKQILLDLRNRRLIELSDGVDCDGMICGSGYMLTSAGVDHINKHMPYQPAAQAVDNANNFLPSTASTTSGGR